MDELELSGSRHISAKRAAKEHRYHSDYIGQLIRGGKVAGQKVGRSWYVDAASLDAYLKGETPLPAPAPAAEVLVPQAPVPEPTPEPAPAPEPTPEPVVVAPVAHPAPAPVERPVHIIRQQPAAVMRPQPVVEDVKPIAPAFGLQFVPDEAPLTQTRVMPAAAQHLVVDESGDEMYEAPVRSTRRLPAALLAVGMCAFLLAFGASFFAVHKSTVAGTTTTAAVHFGL